MFEKWTMKLWESGSQEVSDFSCDAVASIFTVAVTSTLRWASTSLHDRKYRLRCRPRLGFYEVVLCIHRKGRPDMRSGTSSKPIPFLLHDERTVHTATPLSSVLEPLCRSSVQKG